MKAKLKQTLYVTVPTDKIVDFQVNPKAAEFCDIRVTLDISNIKMEAIEILEAAPKLSELRDLAAQAVMNRDDITNERSEHLLKFAYKHMREEASQGKYNCRIDMSNETMNVKGTVIERLRAFGATMIDVDTLHLSWANDAY